jgi:hypothetical protein
VCHRWGVGLIGAHRTPCRAYWFWRRKQSSAVICPRGLELPSHSLPLKPLTRLWSWVHHQ